MHPHSTLYAAFGRFMFSSSRPTIEIVQNSMLGICCSTCTLRRAAFAWKTAFSASCQQTAYWYCNAVCESWNHAASGWSPSQYWVSCPVKLDTCFACCGGNWQRGQVSDCFYVPGTSSPRNITSCHPHVATALSFWRRICNPVHRFFVQCRQCSIFMILKYNKRWIVMLRCLFRKSVNRPIIMYLIELIKWIYWSYQFNVILLYCMFWCFHLWIKRLIWYWTEILDVASKIFLTNATHQELNAECNQ